MSLIERLLTYVDYKENVEFPNNKTVIISNHAGWFPMDAVVFFHYLTKIKQYKQKEWLNKGIDTGDWIYTNNE